MKKMMKGLRVAFVIVILAITLEATAVTGLSLCGMDEDGLTACRPSVTKPTPVDPPAPECCQALAAADLKCLCSYRNSFVLPSLGIDPELAMALPSKCNLSPPSDC